MPVKYTLEHVKKVFEEKGYVLLESEYKNNKEKMKYLCPRHPDLELSISFKSLSVNGSGCPKCGYEKLSEQNRLPFDEVRSEFEKRGYILLETDYRNGRIPLRYICPKHPDKTLKISYSSLKNGRGCNYCGINATIGSNNPNWGGGKVYLNKYLRRFAERWRKYWLKKYDFKCSLTGDDKSIIDVHHSKSFDDIKQEVFDYLNLPIKEDVTEYSVDDLIKISTLIKKKHEEIVGVPLKRELHTLFHKLYGRITTENDFEDFKRRFQRGEFS